MTSQNKRQSWAWDPERGVQSLWHFLPILCCLTSARSLPGIQRHILFALHWLLRKLHQGVQAILIAFIKGHHYVCFIKDT
jgi:hypothetical protein